MSREEALKLFISAVQAAPELIPKNLSGEEMLKYIIKSSEELMNYVLQKKN
ncbi:MAG: hypothetical protein LBL20_05970 [Treponema sp.]|nr:hypothetical protein [Treponema sp.]